MAKMDDRKSPKKSMKLDEMDQISKWIQNKMMSWSEWNVENRGE